MVLIKPENCIFLH